MERGTLLWVKSELFGTAGSTARRDARRKGDSGMSDRAAEGSSEVGSEMAIGAKALPGPDGGTKPPKEEPPDPLPSTGVSPKCRRRPLGLDAVPPSPLKR